MNMKWYIRFVMENHLGTIRLICAIAFLHSLSGMAQERETAIPSALIGVRLGLIPGVVIEKSIGRKTAVFIEAGYGKELILSAGNSMPRSINGEVGLSWLVPEWGDNMRLAISFKAKYREDDYFYQRQRKNEYQDGEDCGDAKAEWWRQKYNFGIKYIVEWTPQNWLRPYAGVGLRYSYIRRHYITKGPCYRGPDERNFFLPTVHAGINIYPIVIKKHNDH